MSDQPITNYVTKEAARRLEINRPALDRLLARPGAPSPNAAKQYDLKELAAFVASQGDAGNLDSLRAARLREIQLRCQRLEMEIARDAGRLVSRAAVDELHGRVGTALRALLYARMENDLPPKLAGCDALTIRKHCRALADELMDTLARGIEHWNP